jgi:ABC-type Co2+ transport system permease subunit
VLFVAAVPLALVEALIAGSVLAYLHKVAPELLLQPEPSGR